MIPINQPCFRINDPKFGAALAEARAAGVKPSDLMDAETFHRSVTTDAAEAIGIPISALDANRVSHLNMMTRVATQLILDEVEASKKS